MPEPTLQTISPKEIVKILTFASAKSAMDNGQQSKLSINLQPHQEELIQLAELAGIRANPRVHNIIIELLNMQAEPQAIFNVLKAISKPKHTKSHSRKSV